MTFLDTPPRQTERSFMNQVIKAAELLGWRYYHTYRSDKSPKGFPDLVLVRARHPEPRVIFLEVKADRTPVTDDQRAWITDLRACGQEAYIARPKHWPNIEKLLEVTAMQSRRLRAVPDAEQAAFGALLCRLRTARLVTVERERARRSGGVARWTTQTTMSQNELARRSGVDAALIWRLEAGERSTLLRSTVLKLAAALELGPDDATLLLIAAGYWPWHALDDETALLVAQTAIAVIAGDYRALEES